MSPIQEFFEISLFKFLAGISALKLVRLFDLGNFPLILRYWVRQHKSLQIGKSIFTIHFISKISKDKPSPSANC